MTIATFGGGSGGSSDTGVPRDQLVTLQFRFVDPTNNQPIDPVAPVVRFTHDGKPMSVVALGAAESPDHSYPLAPNSPAVVGLWRFSFMIAQTAPGLYGVEAHGPAVLSDSNTATLVAKGSLGIGEISFVDDLINRLRTSLFDDEMRIRQYLLDQPLHQWNIDELYVFLREACQQVNTIGPRATSFDLTSFPTGAGHLLIDGAGFRALRARARFEAANEMDYSDGHTLSIKRSGPYLQMANQMETAFIASVKSWKMSRPPRTIALGSQRVPFRLTRILGLLPSSSAFFSS